MLWLSRFSSENAIEMERKLSSPDEEPPAQPSRERREGKRPSRDEDAAPPRTKRWKGDRELGKAEHSVVADSEKYEESQEAIESGDTELVGRLVRNLPSGQHQSNATLNQLLPFCKINCEKKETLFSTDDDGHNFIHTLVLKDSSEESMKHLSVVKETIDDETFKDLLKSVTRDSKNVFHLVSARDVLLEDLLQFCVAHLDKEEIKEMLLSTDEDGRSVIYLLVRKNSSETLVKNLRDIKEILGDEEWFKGLLKSKNKCSTNIFHLSTRKDMYLGNLLQFSLVDLGIEELKEMFCSADVDGNNVIHLLALKNSSEMLMRNLRAIKECFHDDRWLTTLLKTKGSYFRNVFHLSALRDMCLQDLLEFYVAHLDGGEIKEMLLSNDEDDFNIIHILVLRNSSERLMENLKLLQETVEDSEWFEGFVKSKGQSLKNVLQIASIEDRSLEILLKFCDALLEKDELKEMLLCPNKYDYNVLHVSVLKNNPQRLIRNLKTIEEVVDDGEWFLRFLQSNGYFLRNAFHLAALTGVCLGDLLSFCDERLGKEKTKDMLLSTDEDDFNVIHLLVLKNSSEMLMENLRCIRDATVDALWFKRFLKSKGQSLKNIFHLACMENMNLDGLLRFCDAHLDKDEIKEMLWSTNYEGYNVIHVLVLKSSTKTVLRNLRAIEETVGDTEWFKGFLKSKSDDFKDIFDLSSSRDFHVDEIMRFCDTYFDKE